MASLFDEVMTGKLISTTVGGGEVVLSEVIRSSANATTTYTATGDISATTTVHLVDATTGPVTATLPLAASAVNQFYYIKKVDVSANAVTVEGNGAETIDGAANQSLAAQYNAITVYSDGTEWFIFASV